MSNNNGQDFDLSLDEIDALLEDINDDLFVLQDLASIYQVSEEYIKDIAKKHGVDKILTDYETDEYVYLHE